MLQQQLFVAVLAGVQHSTLSH